MNIIRSSHHARLLELSDFLGVPVLQGFLKLTHKVVMCMQSYMGGTGQRAVTRRPSPSRRGWACGQIETSTEYKRARKGERVSEQVTRGGVKHASKCAQAVTQPHTGAWHFH